MLFCQKTVRKISSILTRHDLFCIHMTMADSLKKILRRDWQEIAQSVVKKRGRKLEDLRFAKRTSHGYAFFLTKKIEWDILHEIASEVAKVFPHLDYAYVAETCSEFLNTDGEEVAIA